MGFKKHKMARSPVQKIILTCQIYTIEQKLHMYYVGWVVTYVEDIKCSANAVQRLFLLATVDMRLIWRHCRCSMFFSTLTELQVRFCSLFKHLTLEGMVLVDMKCMCFKYIYFVLYNTHDKNVWTYTVDLRSKKAYGTTSLLATTVADTLWGSSQ